MKPGSVAVVAVALLSGCGGSRSESYGRFYRCDYESGAVYLTVAPCSAEEPEQNYVRPTTWGVAGGGFPAYADTTSERPVFYLVSGDYEIDTADRLFLAENLTALPAGPRERRLAEGRALVRLSVP